MDPDSKYLLGMHPDERGIEVGIEFVRKMTSKLRDRFSPIYMTDGYRVYNEAFLERMGEWTKAEYGGRGRPPIAKWGYSPRFNYGQVIKTRQGKKLEKVEYRILSGNVPDDKFNTSSIERMNLTIRNGMARLKRISQTFSKSLKFLEGGCDLFRGIYNFCRPHMTLMGTDGKRTPAMELGLTDRIWSMRELMTFSYRQNIS